MRTLLVALSLLLLLGGCSGLRTVDSQVKAVSTLPEGSTPLADARYRFERLPSQTDPVETDSVEAIAEAELAEVGLVHDDANARYSVQLSTRMQPYSADPWGRPFDGGRLRGSIMIGGGLGGMYGLGMGMGTGVSLSTQYRQYVTLLQRD